MNWTAVALAAGVFAASFAGTRLVLGCLRRRRILDHPNPRSSHAAPTPRGGGLAVVPVLLLAWAGIALARPQVQWEVLAVSGGALGLAVLSWLDDLKGLPVGARLAAQAAAVILALAAMPASGGFFAGALPPALDVVAAALVWVWFVNLFNFMDGIDGIAGTETACLGAGVAVAATVAALEPATALYGIAAAAAALGFLWWNWHPARIFLGDVGSVPLGFVLGWLLLGLAAEGLWAAALALPLYYLADATITLARRALRGETVWQAHRQHFYQRAVQQGLSHAAVVRAVFAANLLLIALAGAAALGWQWQAAIGAGLVVLSLLFYLAAAPAPAPRHSPPAAKP